MESYVNKSLGFLAKNIIAVNIKGNYLFVKAEDIEFIKAEDNYFLLGFSEIRKKTISKSLKR